jgi:hypothetical protein
LEAIPRAIGLAKNGMPCPEPMRSKISLSSSGGIAEPSAKWSQYVKRRRSSVPAGGLRRPAP